MCVSVFLLLLLLQEVQAGREVGHLQCLAAAALPAVVL